MARFQPTNFNRLLLTLATYGTLVLVAWPALLATEDARARWLGTWLYLIFAVLFLFYLASEHRPWRVHLYLLLQTAIMLALLRLEPTIGLESHVLFFVLSAQGMLFLPVAHGAVWLVLFALITLTTGAWFYDWGWSEVLGELTTVAGFFFFGAFGAMLRQADQARRRSDRLREQLETANEQLESAALQSQQLAIAEERNRLARELHDALGHRLTVAIVQLEGARRLMPSQPDRAATMIEAMRGELKEGLAELRRSVATLRTPITEALTLPKALTRLAEGFRQATGLALELSVAEPLPELPPGHQHALFRAAQECLTNIQRHAGARQAWLDLKADNGAVVLTASDDGRGFAPSLALDRYGLLGLQERAQQLGGNLSLDNRPDGGAQIAMRLPLPPPANHHG